MIAISWSLGLSLLLAAPQAPAGEPAVVLDVWPEGKVPGASPEIGPEHPQAPRPGQKPAIRLTDVSRPTLSVYRPPSGKDTGAAVVIAPGGGYNILAWDLEGTEVAARLNAIGVTGIVLKYRVPRRADEAKDRPPDRAYRDARRALRVVRARAKEWGIDPDRVGMLGFSAGGNLTARAALGVGPDDERVDDVDSQSARPDFAVLVYPAYLEEKGSLRSEYAEAVNGKAPPMFLVHAGDDPISPMNSVALYSALKAARVPAELHVYASGGHGFGLRPSEHPCSAWPDRLADWLKNQGWLAPRGGK